MDFNENMIGDVLVIKSTDDNANIGNATVFKSLALERIENGQKKIIVDLTDVPLVDSTFLGAMVVVNRKITSVGGSLKLCGTNEPIFTLLGLTKLDKVFVSFDTIEEAIKSFE